ncbi:MAG: Gfo/Idh/MocA family oxidoreductase [Solirubrobacterales bacterium]|nr:Gfo/Idh/MocA family oxidoreductase [Solirubrobacterales bacterium]
MTRPDLAVETTRGVIQFGAGSWGMSWLGKIEQSAHFELRALIEPVAGAREAALAAGVAPDLCFGGLDEALAAGVEAQVGVVVTPPATHLAVAHEAMEAGLDLLVEKPLADTLESARELVDRAEELGRRLMVSQNYRFKRAPRTVQRLVTEGAVGRIEQVRIVYQKDPPFADFRVQMDEPVIIDMAVHHLDQIRGLLGLEPVRLRARSWNPSWSRFRGNASALIEMETAEGVQIIYTGSWCSTGAETTWDGEWDIQGERGGILWRQNQVRLSFTSVFDTVFLPGAHERDGTMDVDLDPVPLEERAGVLGELHAALDEERVPETHGRDNLRSLALVLAAVESARADGAFVELAPTEATAGK